MAWRTLQEDKFRNNIGENFIKNLENEKGYLWVIPNQFLRTYFADCCIHRMVSLPPFLNFTLFHYGII